VTAWTSRLGRRLSSPWFLVAVGLLAAVSLPIWLGETYGRAAVWLGLVGNFTASFAAFLVALRWDRRQREAEGEERERQGREALEREAVKEHDRRESETRRRFTRSFQN
jgi:hypothetical protein